MGIDLSTNFEFSKYAACCCHLVFGTFRLIYYYEMGPLEIEIERMDTAYPSCRGKELEIREPETDHEIGQALGEMTHELAMKDLRYNTPHWCYDEQNVWVRQLFEPRCEKTGLRGFRPGLTQTGLCSHTIWLEA